MRSDEMLLPIIMVLISVVLLILAYLAKKFAKPDIQELKTRNDVNGLIRALKNKRFSYLAGHAAIALGELRDKKAVNPLVRLLGDSTADSSYKVHSAIALGRIGDTQSIEPLRDAMERDSEKEVRTYAAVGLWLLGVINISVVFSLFLKNRVWLFPFSHYLDSYEKTKAAKQFYEQLSSGKHKEMLGIAFEATGSELLEVTIEDVFSSEINQTLFVDILEQCMKKDHFELIKHFCGEDLVNGLNAENRLRILNMLWSLIYAVESYGGKYVSQKSLETFYRYKPIWEWAVNIVSGFRSDKDDRVRETAEDKYSYWHRQGN